MKLADCQFFSHHKIIANCRIILAKKHTRRRKRKSQKIDFSTNHFLIKLSIYIDKWTESELPF